MSVKLITKGARERKNENAQRKVLHPHSTIQKPAVFHNISKSSPVLSDTSEFPSLNESSGKATNNSYYSGRILKYSDKLKLHSFSQNQKSVSESFHSTSDTVVTDAHIQISNRTSGTKILNKWHHNEDKSNLRKEVENISQSDSAKSRILNTEKVKADSSQHSPKKQPNHSLKQCTPLKQKLTQDNKMALSKPKHLVKSSTKCSTSDKTSLNSPNATFISKSNNQMVSHKSTKFGTEQNESKEEESDDMQCNAKAKKKKKRKSKVKRQVALQSGKITVLTPEVHFKILNKTSALTLQSSNSILTDINDEEEYPELGKSLLPASQKENSSKKDISTELSKKSVEKPSDVHSEESLSVPKEVPWCDISDKKSSTEKKGKNDNKPATVHPNDPITISFYDILLNKNPKTKVRDLKEEIDVPNSVGMPKIKMKKNASKPHNLLDSSSPMIKRGKEREKPKPKKPSQLKKIILLDRKARKQQLLLLKNHSSEENAAIDNELIEVSAGEADSEVDTVEADISIENNYNVSENQQKVTDQTLLLLSDNDNNSLQDELVPKMEQINLLERENHWTVVNNLSSDNANEDAKSGNNLDGSSINLSLDKISKNDKDSSSESKAIMETVCLTETPSNISHSSDLLNCLISNVKKLEVSDKERAAKVLLHTRNFREYCNHLISKDIDDAVFALLDDLARFQDRLHQKDPVKARMKRRMIYGVKEVKKHIKLKKLKCIIIAVDIENVEAQGGLNDVLNDIKMLAADHHIPCVFALSRKVLGKLCRKPVPVSCVGVFNFEGSEANFKKMVELQTQSKIDYNEIFNKLTSKLTDEEVATLLKAKKEAPETLRSIRTDILNDFFMQSKTDAVENDSTDLKLDNCQM